MDQYAVESAARSRAPDVAERLAMAVAQARAVPPTPPPSVERRSGFRRWVMIGCLSVVIYAGWKTFRPSSTSMVAASSPASAGPVVGAAVERVSRPVPGSESLNSGNQDEVFVAGVVGDLAQLSDGSFVRVGRLLLGGITSPDLPDAYIIRYASGRKVNAARGGGSGSIRGGSGGEVRNAKVDRQWSVATPVKRLGNPVPEQSPGGVRQSD